MSLSIGDHGNAVRRLQRKLQAEGFDPGTVDGKFGEKTREAVQKFQSAHGLRPDGAVGEDTTAALRHQMVGQDRFEAPPTQPSNDPSRTPGTDGVAQIDRTTNAGRRNQRVDGHITVNGHTYDFRSGGHGRGSLPTGSYDITMHRMHRNDRSMSVDGVGYSFAVSDKFDSRVGGTRRLLRIHPDGGTPGTEGCMGIVGDGATQRQFRADMAAEIQRHGGHYRLTVQ